MCTLILLRCESTVVKTGGISYECMELAHVWWGPDEGSAQCTTSTAQEKTTQAYHIQNIIILFQLSNGTQTPDPVFERSETLCTLDSLVSDQKYLESFEMWYWRRMEKISWADRVRNEEVLHTVKEERTILHTIKWRQANWIGHSLRRNCLLKPVIEGKIQEVRERRGSRRNQLQDDLEETCR